MTKPLANALAGLAALAVAMGVGRFAFTPIMPMMLRDAGLTLASGAWLASANYLGYLLGALSAMAWRVRPELAIRGGLLAIGLVTAAMGASLPIAAWLLLRLVAGIASAWVLISVSAWSLEALARFQRPVLGSVVFAGVGVGIAAAGLLCVGLNLFDQGSTTAWYALGAAALAVTVLIWPIFKSHAAPVANAAQDDAGNFHWNGEAKRLVFCYGVFGFGYIIPATFLPVMARNALPGLAAFDCSWPLFGLAAALSTLAVAPLARHMSNRRMWILSQCTMASGMLLAALRPQLSSILIAALCVGGTFMVITLLAMQEARHLAGRHAARLIAAMTAAFAIGQIIGPLTVRAAAGAASFSGGLTIAAILLIGSTLALRKPKSNS